MKKSTANVSFHKTTNLIEEEPCDEGFFDCVTKECDFAGLEADCKRLRNKCVAMDKRLSRLEENMPSENYLIALMKRICLGDSSNSSRTTVFAKKGVYHQVEKKSVPQKDHFKSQSNKGTVFPFFVGDVHVKKFTHEFSFEEKVYLTDEYLIVTVVDETKNYVRVLDGISPVARLKSKTNVSRAKSYNK